MNKKEVNQALDTKNTTTPDKQSLEQEQIFSIENLYVKNLSLESPRVPQVFFEKLQPEIDIKFHIDSQKVQDGYYESTVSATVTAKLEKSVVFLCEASQGGLFNIENVEEKSLEYLLNVSCPNILFPYLRELVSQAIVRAGFPPIFLVPINFEAMYHQQMMHNPNTLENA